jgi:hypothetical protein
MGQTTISMAIFNSELLNYQRIVMIAIKCGWKIPAAKLAMEVSFAGKIIELNLNGELSTATTN